MELPCTRKGDPKEGDVPLSCQNAHSIGTHSVGVCSSLRYAWRLYKFGLNRRVNRYGLKCRLSLFC